MAKRLEKQLEFDFMKEVEIKKQRKLSINETTLHKIGHAWHEIGRYSILGLVGIAVLNDLLYEINPQIYESVKNSIEYLF